MLARTIIRTVLAAAFLALMAALAVWSGWLRSRSYLIEAGAVLAACGVGAFFIDQAWRKSDPQWEKHIEPSFGYVAPRSVRVVTRLLLLAAGLGLALRGLLGVGLRP